MPPTPTDSFYPSFLADLIVAICGSLIGFGTALFVYWKGLMQTRKDRLKYLASLLSSVSLAAKQQANNCSEFADELKTNPFTKEILKLVANRDPKRLADKVDQEGVYHAFLWKYGRNNHSYKAFEDLYRYIDYVDYLIDDQIKTNERILLGTWERKKDYQKSFTQAQELMKHIQIDEELNSTQPALVEKITEILHAFGEKERTSENLQDAQNSVVMPVLSFLKYAKRHPKITELFLTLENINNQYRGMELQAKHNAQDYEQYGKQLNEATEKLTCQARQIVADFKTT